MVSSLCKYADIFGKPGAGVHAYRLGGLAVVDVALTVLGAWLLSKLLDTDFWLTLVLTFIAGIVIHRLFCVNTTLNRLIFGRVSG